MNHKDEAIQQLEALEFGEVSSNFHAQTGELKSDAIAIAQVKATLALVEAQEAANEQARIANLIAVANLAFGPGEADMTEPWTGSGEEKAWDVIRAEVIEALGIKGGNQ